MATKPISRCKTLTLVFDQEEGFYMLIKDSNKQGKQYRTIKQVVTLVGDLERKIGEDPDFTNTSLRIPEEIKRKMCLYERQISRAKRRYQALEAAY